MIEDKKTKHPNNLNRIGNTEIILILFHFSDFCSFKQYYKEYIYKYLFLR